MFVGDNSRLLSCLGFTVQSRVTFHPAGGTQTTFLCRTSIRRPSSVRWGRGSADQGPSGSGGHEVTRHVVLQVFANHIHASVRVPLHDASVFFGGGIREKTRPQALGLDRQPVSQTRTLTLSIILNIILNPNHNHNPIREMRLTNVSLIYITI